MSLWIAMAVILLFPMAMFHRGFGLKLSDHFFDSRRLV